MLSFLHRVSASSNPLDIRYQRSTTRTDRLDRFSAPGRYRIASEDPPLKRNSPSICLRNPSGVVASPAVSQGRAVNRKNAYSTRENGRRREELGGLGISFVESSGINIARWPSWRVYRSSRARIAFTMHTRVIQLAGMCTRGYKTKWGRGGRRTNTQARRKATREFIPRIPD